MSKTHRIEIGGLVRDLPFRTLPNGLIIAFLNVQEDVPLVQAAARELAELLPSDTQVILTPEGKSTNLGFELARLTGYQLVIPRKELKDYMVDVVSVGGVQSVTTKPLQAFHMDSSSAALLEGKKFAFCDDVVSRCGTLFSSRALAAKLNAIEVAALAICTEGDGPWPGVRALAHLPIGGVYRPV